MYVLYTPIYILWTIVYSIEINHTSSFKNLSDKNGYCNPWRFDHEKKQKYLVMISLKLFLLDEKPYWWDISGQFEEVVGLAANATTALARGGPTWIATTVSAGEDPILKFTKGKVSQVKTYICKHDEKMFSIRDGVQMTSLLF